MYSLLTLDGQLHTLCCRVETESVGQALSSHKAVWIQIDAPFDITVGSLRQQIGLLSNSGTVAIEGANDVDFLIGSRAERGNKLQQYTVCPCFKLLTLMIEYDVILLRTAAHQS